MDVSADIHYRNEQFSEIEEPAYERNEFVQRNETLVHDKSFEQSFDNDVDAQDKGTNTNNMYFFHCLGIPLPFLTIPHKTNVCCVCDN